MNYWVKNQKNKIYPPIIGTRHQKFSYVMGFFGHEYPNAGLGR